MFEYASSRPFEVIRYAHSHGPLLICNSLKDQAESLNRVEILFYDVRSVEMRMWFEGLSIRESDLIDGEDFASKPTEMHEIGLRFFLLRGATWSGYVLAGSATVHEEAYSAGKKSHFRQVFETPQGWEARRSFAE